MADLRGLKVDSFQCRNHPEREGVGICVACRRVFCIECSTKIDGINHCRECLAKRARTAVATTSKPSGWFARGLDSVASLSVVAASVVIVTVLFVAIGESSAQGGALKAANTERMVAIARALGAYQRDVGSFPTTGQGLAALRVRPAGVKNWHGPYLDGSAAKSGLVVDSYGHEVVYRAPTPADPGCAVASKGGNHELETDLENVKKLVGSTDGEAIAEGDDVVYRVE